jgi:hypothetical protein
MRHETVRLVSDFHDYYDYWFDGYDAELTFERRSTGGMPRREMLEYLRSLGLRVPDFGRPAEVYDQLRRRYNALPDEVFDYIQQVVVHLDETAHCGKGKIRLPLSDAAKQYPDCLAVEYIPALPSGQGQTLRYLQVGDKVFWLEYTSQNDWRSNCGDVNIRVLSQEEDGYHPRVAYPLFAIDFVRGDALYAIDFNVAPGIRCTGVEDILPAKAAAEAIKKAVVLFSTLKERSKEFCG